MTASLYWHDYETFGIDPRRDRPAQFAGQRTDEALNPLGDPLVIYCRPTADYLPNPEACLLTGITPLLALQEGLPECEFIGQIAAELARPGTCGVGYNSIRFDDEFTRNTLYRNLRDPYAREWRDRNSRWDIIDLARMAYALRPQGVEWPSDADGLPLFRLELLTQANGIEHSQAHDALADVQATIEFARCLRRAQPRLYNWFYGLRRKQAVLALLAARPPQPILHVSGMYAREQGCLAPVLPLARHPENANEYIVFDLRQAPDELFDLDGEALAERLYTPTSELGPGQQRLALKTVHANRSPALAPMATLGAETAVKWSIDLAAVDRHAQALLAAQAHWQHKLATVFARSDRPADSDPDLAIYSGGFFSDADRREMTRAVSLDPDQLGRSGFDFEDPRLDEMLFRYRARNHPQTLTPAEATRWRAFCASRLRDGDAGVLTLQQFQAEIQRLRAENPQGSVELLDELQAYAAELAEHL